MPECKHAWVVASSGCDRGIAAMQGCGVLVRADEGVSVYRMLVCEVLGVAATEQLLSGVAAVRQRWWLAVRFFCMQPSGAHFFVLCLRPSP